MPFVSHFVPNEKPLTAIIVTGHGFNDRRQGYFSKDLVEYRRTAEHRSFYCRVTFAFQPTEEIPC